MKTEEKTVQSLAQEMYDNLEKATRDDGSEYYRMKTVIDWQRDIIYSAHKGNMPRDYIYEFVNDAVYAISEADDDIEEAIYSIEPSVYTSELTKWLHSSCSNVYYLTEALEEYETKDGFQLLTMAYSKAQQEVANNVLNGLRDRLEEIAE